MLLSKKPERMALRLANLEDICASLLTCNYFDGSGDNSIHFQYFFPFADWSKGFDSAEVVAMHKNNAIKHLYSGVCKDNSESVVVTHQAEEGVARSFFEASREAVEATGHIYDSTVITSYLAG